ncbi:universal stress protein [Stackebrandtia nassauensis]|uniref:UspA domain protein n=1 Tax=Stackebrandtia nassauensis (strain DSM 44728 / CIP 108903 / NRRL B-16338 / NBRC 102104 / LLR-40K-21) TaxID=446470 RepID=D3PVM5_STANL|nr:universal stress protein [Stackebrandtia nassauensis]ADD43139.1 UspA domain protein [Stackebrandtia nassauensis DSM 44728]
MAAPIVVGFDGSDNSRRAVDWAAEEARLRHRPLLIVHSLLVFASVAAEIDGSRIEEMRAESTVLVDDEIARVRELAPGLDVRGETLEGMTPSVDLLKASLEAASLVVGSRGRGTFASLLLGSTSSQVAAHSHCPVIVVRGDRVGGDAKPGHVVVGVDGSPLSQSVLRFGFEEASMRGTRLVAVHAWLPPAPADFGDLLPTVYDVDALAADEERLLAESLAGWQAKFPDVPVERVCVRADARRVLKDESAGARLLVVGSRGGGGFTGLLLGSITQAMVHHAHAAVAIVHPGH